SINKLLEPNSCQITDNFYKLKLEEMHLVYAAHEKINLEQNEERLKLAKFKEEGQSPADLGYVYILSNIGVLGEDVYKIGMTKRQNPVAYINEMSDNSVPFSYDIHAVIQSDDAVALAKLLHQEFAAKRINKLNMHKDFFKVNLGEIEAACRKYHKGDFKLNPICEAKEWRQSVAIAKSEKKKAA
ncbi:MAG: GIY-YIG nuclease family protein, partial [Bdellovibrionaceae bacterium]|nr:GIY-YIG nuclease family protein [Pseudobdellovibrionaceae bacterium]